MVKSIDFVVALSVVLVVGIMIAMMWGLIRQKRVNVTYALVRKERRKRLLFKTLAIGLGVGAWFFCQWSAAHSLNTVWMMIGGSIFAGFFHQPLRVARYRDGEFWLKGCSPAFLDSLVEA